MVLFSLLTLPLAIGAARSAFADTISATTATVSSSDGLNMRSGPATTYPVVAVIPGGTTVTITGTGTPDNWLPIQYQGQTGWADGTYLALSQPAAGGASAGPPAVAAAAPAPAAAPVVAAAAPASAAAATPAAAPAAASSATVTPSDGLNLRSGPGSSSTVVSVLPGGATVKITGTANGTWVPVSYNGSSGWVDSSFLATGASPAITSSSSSSSGGATVGGSSSGAPLNAASFGSPVMGQQAPAEAGLSVATAPAGTTGKFIWPVDGRRITTTFKSYHQAIDIDQFPSGGNPVRAIADGIVTYSGGDRCCSYGLYLIIAHSGGFSSLYAHCSALEVNQGQLVRQGQEICRSGNTGNSTGAHLHFAIYLNGQPLDPLTVLPNDGVQIWGGA